MNRVTGNYRLLKAFKMDDYKTIEHIIINKEYIKNPLNYSLEASQYDFYRYLVDTYSHKIELQIDNNFILKIPDYETLKITQKAYNKKFDENLVLYRLQNMASTNKETRYIFNLLFILCLVYCLNSCCFKRR